MTEERPGGEMTLVEHLEELRTVLLQSLLAASVAALNGDQSFLIERNDAFKQRRELVPTFTAFAVVNFGRPIACSAMRAMRCSNPEYNPRIS